MQRRGLSEEDVTAVALAPEQVIVLRSGRILAQSIRRMGVDKVYLLRVILDLYPDRADIVTAYRTSQIARYWKGVP